MYNLTPLYNNTGMASLLVYANDSASGYFGLFLMIALFFVLLFMLIRYGFPIALFTSSTSAFILSLFLVYMEVLLIKFALLFLVIAAFAGMIIYIIDR